MLTLRNTTRSVVPVPPLTLELARVAGGSGKRLAVPALGELPAGGERMYRVPFELPSGVGGTYLVRGSLEGAPGFTKQTSHRAWGFFALDAVLVLLLVAAVLWRIVRSRRGRRAAAPQGRHRAGPVGEPLLTPVPLSDLLATK